MPFGMGGMMPFGGFQQPMMGGAGCPPWMPGCNGNFGGVYGGGGGGGYGTQSQGGMGAAPLNEAAQITQGGISPGPSGGTTIGYSDARLKEDIKPLESALDIVDRLEGHTFRWRDGKDAIGVIAQEVEKVAPDLVLEDKYGTKMVDALGLNAILIEAVKELKAELRSRA